MVMIYIPYSDNEEIVQSYAQQLVINDFSFV